MASLPNRPNTPIVALPQWVSLLSSSPPLPPPLPTPDVTKIVNAPIDIVRAVLIALCHDPQQEKKAMAHFVKLQELRSKQHEGLNDGTSTGDTDTPNSDRGVEKDSNDGRADANKPSKKRALPEISICTLCEEPFIEDENSPSACMYHPGSTELDEDSSVYKEYDWDTWNADPAEGGYIDEFPEWYQMSCCKQPIDSIGCAQGSHESLHKKRQNGQDRQGRTTPNEAIIWPRSPPRPLKKTWT